MLPSSGGYTLYSNNTAVHTYTQQSQLQHTYLKTNSLKFLARVILQVIIYMLTVNHMNKVAMQSIAEIIN